MRIKIRRILCPVDFSEHAEQALRYAKAFAQAHQAELILLHVVETPVAYMAPDVVLPADTVDSQRAACTERLTALTTSVRDEHANTTWLLVDGNPLVLIVETAAAREVDLIVIGTHGRTGLAHVLLGSVAETVVRKAPCPVLTVKHPEHEFVVP
jgi:nucleotide-binding universal stress UspA family protein